MANNKGLKIVGQIHKIGKIEDVTPTFNKRDIILFVLNERNEKYSDHIKFQFTQDRCDLLENFAEGEQVEITFDITGRLFKSKKTGEDDCFPNLNGYQIRSMTPAAAPIIPDVAPATKIEAPKGMPVDNSTEIPSDLPF